MSRIYNRIRTIVVICLVLGLVFCMVNLGCSRGCFKREKIVQPSAKSQEKFGVISKWIPGTANAILTIDIYKLSHSTLWDDLINLGKVKLWKNLRASGIDFKSDIGMVTIFMDITSASEAKGPVMIIQGGFNRHLILSRIKRHAAQEGLTLKTERYKDIEIYQESEAEETFGGPYAFATLSNGLIAAAKVDDIKWIIDSKNARPAPSPLLQTGLNWERPIWGKITVAQSFSSTMPPPWNGIDSIQFDANISEDLDAKIVANLKNGYEVKKLKSALEGFKALEAIHMLDDKEMLEAIEKISITEDGQKISIEIPQELKLINLILSKYMEKQETEDEKKENNQSG